MKLETAGFEVTTNTTEAKEFGIRSQDMGIVLNILRSKLYSDPIGTICREIMSNALDAHTAAGREEVPIEVFLPNNWESNLKIKDTGIGMSKKLIEEHFLNYGASTKRETSEIGCFGLGSKSPWSYTSTFSIDTISDGTRYVYSALIDETQRGKIFLLHTEPTTERNGTTVVIPVKSSDFRVFERSIYYYSTFFRVRPVIHNSSGTERWALDDYRDSCEYKGDGWGILSSSAFAKAATALVGVIPYPLDIKALGDSSSPIKSLLSNTLILELDPTEVSLSASRESIHYDERTIEVIKSKLEAIVEELAKTFLPAIESCSNLWDATLEYKKVKSWIDVYLPNYKPCWKGLPLQISYSISPFVVVTYKPEDSECNIITKSTSRYYTSLSPTHNAVLILMDVNDRNVLCRIRTVLKQNPGKYVLLVKDAKGPIERNTTHTLKPGILESLIAMGGVFLSDVSLTRVPRLTNSKSTEKDEIVREKKPKGLIRGFKFNKKRKSSKVGMYKYADELYVDPELKGIYLTINKGSLGNLPTLVDAGLLDPTFCPEFLSALLNLLDIRELYFFREDSVPEGWKSLKEVVDLYVKCLVDTNSLFLFSMILRRNCNLFFSIRKVVKAVGPTNIPKGSSLEKILSVPFSSEALSSTPESFRNTIYSLVSRDIREDIVQAVDKLLEEASKDFPLLFYVHHQGIQGELLDAIIKYIKYTAIVESQNGRSVS